MPVRPARQGQPKTFAVPRTKSRHMANQILKDAGLEKAF